VLRGRDGHLYLGWRRGFARRLNTRRVDPEKLTVWLFPLLELEPTEVSPDVLSELPLTRILTDALEDGYWAPIAVEWLRRTGVPEDVRPSLLAFAHCNIGTQASRHSARRVLKATEPSGRCAADDRLRTPGRSPDP
jgi:hypothetical protein